MFIYNTLTKQKELFSPIKDNKVKIYLCGPTVYDFAHLGHGRSATAFDIIRKYLIFKGYNVTFVSNYTDIDDKIIQRAKVENLSITELAEKIIPHYIEDYGKLNILPPDITPKATTYINEMITIVGELLKNNIAYKLNDGIYFDISKDKEYGKLSGQKIKDLQTGARIKEKTNKKNPQDFVLWKFAKPNEPSWETEFGAGRPGWHIECSAMSMKLLGDTFDIHGGGLDLIFPHHECEIAQSEMFTKKQYVKYWMHNGFINVDNEKMSKSLGNFFTLKDIFKKYNPIAVRLFLISTHYRSPINFSDAQLEQSTKTLKRLNEFIFSLKNYNNSIKNNTKVKEYIDILKMNFIKAMDNDFEVPEALGSIFTFIKEINKLIFTKKISTSDAMSILHIIRELNSVLGIFEEQKNELIDINIDAIIKERENARKRKDYDLSDKLRNDLLAQNIQLIDTPDGVKWRKI